MGYFPEYVAVELFTNVAGVDTWTNISAYVTSDIKAVLGFSDITPLDRLAPGGDIRFDLNNVNSAFDPSTTFYKGQKIRVRVKYGSLLKTKFFGYIDLITLDPGTWGQRKSHVVAIDWLGLAAKTPVRALAGLTNTTIDVAVTALLTQMQIQPERLDLEEGEITMPSVFDKVTENSTIYSELQNLVMGEWGYIYMRDGGETLKVESALSRIGDGADYKTTSYYVNDGIGTDFLLEDNTNFLLEDNTNFLLEGDPTAASFTSNLGLTYNNILIKHGNDLLNKINASAVPVVIGGGVLVLYPFDITTGSKALLVPNNNSDMPFILQGQYVDPTAGGAQISGSSIVTPVVTTDWKFNSKADGTGTDLSANLTITFTAGVSGFKAVIVNSGAAGYITKFNVRGLPVYRYAPNETIFRDQRSIWDYGDYSLQFTREYGANSNDIAIFMQRLLMRDRKPRTKYSNPKFNGFDTQDHLAGFLCLDVGDQIRLASTKPSMDALYYIQGVRFTIKPGNELVTFEYVTAESTVATELSLEQTSKSQAVDFNYIPSVSNLTYRTFCARIYLSALANADTIICYGNSKLKISLSSMSIGGVATLGVTLTYNFGSTNLNIDTTLGPALLFAAGWFNIVVKFTLGLSGPVEVYINNVAQTVSTTAGTGTTPTEDGDRLVLGNLFFNTYQSNGFVGKMENIAIYNRLLTVAEISTIHNSGVRLPFASYPQTDLKFFFGGMDADDYNSELNTTLSNSDTVYDLQNGFAGQPINSPTLRAVG